MAITKLKSKLLCKHVSLDSQQAETFSSINRIFDFDGEETFRVIVINAVGIKPLGLYN